jgi:glyoxylase-like metal-dependent hydrolase (beta-lactamase superfamily II)
MERIGKPFRTTVVGSVMDLRIEGGRTMKTIIIGCLTLGLVMTCAVAGSQQDEPQAPVTSEPLTGTLHRITCLDNVHSVASIGSDGVLLVDTCYDRTADAMREAIDELVDNPAGEIRYILNTHAHGDHVGGNAMLGPRATIVAHRTVRERMGRYFALPPVSVEGLPDILIDHELTVVFNGEQIRLIPIGRNAHSDGDVVVLFVESNVAFLGDLVFADSYPGADLGMGGDVDGLVATIQELVEMLPEDARLIPSHGREYTMDDLARYGRMTVETAAAVRRETTAGGGAGVDESVLEEWQAEWGNGIQSAAGWIANIAASDTGGRRTPISAPLTETIVSDGIEAAVARYHRLKEERPDDYDFGENQLNMLGYQLLARSMVSEALEVFKLNVAAFPEAFNPYDSLGEAYLAAGNTELAIANYSKSLELNPDNDNARQVLQGIRSTAE